MSDPIVHDLTADEIKRWLHYDPDTGKFVWIRCASNRAPVGFVPTCTDGKGYIVIRLHGQMHRAHRLAWVYMTGEWPTKLIDHENRVKTDNRWINLRLATGTENGANKVQPKGVSGLKGVTWAADRGLWFARIKIKGRGRFLGYFEDKYAAHEAYKRAAEQHFGEFARFE